MFTIDFLKTKGLPKKSHPFCVAGVAVGVVLPAVLVGLMALWHFGNGVSLRSKRQSAEKISSMVAESSADKGLGERVNKRMLVYKDCTGEVAESIGRYVQWTPVLREFIETMPDSMVLNQLDVLRTIEKVKIPSLKDPKKKVDFEIVHRVLKGDIYDVTDDTDDVGIEGYLKGLRESKSLNGVFETVYIEVTKDDIFEGIFAKHYVINCQLRSQEAPGS